jgi:hypothetical protein
MKISQVQEESVFERKIYLGVENFNVVAVNPTLDEMKDMGMNPNEEPQYVTKVEREYDGVKQEYDQVQIRMFLDNNNENMRIRTQVSFNIVKTNHLSSTGKYLVLNKYGSSTWLEEDYIGADELPANMQWYMNEDVKKAYRGEPGLVDLMKALYNLPYVNQKSTKEVKEKGVAMFGDADLEKLFKGDFTALRKMIVVNAAQQEVGFLLGAKEVEGEYRQTLFGRMPLKSYVKKTNKTDKLVKEVADAQANNAYADVIFDLGDTKLKEFNAELHAETPDNNIGGDDDDDLPF